MKNTGVPVPPGDGNVCITACFLRNFPRGSPETPGTPPSTRGPRYAEIYRIRPGRDTLPRQTTLFYSFLKIPAPSNRRFLDRDRSSFGFSTRVTLEGLLTRQYVSRCVINSFHVSCIVQAKWNNESKIKNIYIYKLICICIYKLFVLMFYKYHTRIINYKLFFCLKFCNLREN